MKYLLFILSLITLQAAAQDFNVNLIPDSLKKDADAVKRFEELKIIIKSPDKAVIRHKYAITILNEKASKEATLVVHYSKFREVNDIDGTLYNKDGKKLKNVKRRDILDVSNTDDGTLIDDSRVKAFRFPYEEYPYTIKFETEIEFNGIFGLPAWMPVSDESLSVQESKFIVEVPSDYQFRYKQLNFSKEPVVTDKSGDKTYEWAVQNIPAITDERYSPDWNNVLPYVFVAPSQFEYGGYKGNMSTWSELGKYIYSLYQGRSTLPDAIKQDIHAIADNITDPNEKIRKLYEYLQKNTRYISIQLGIGGLQPFEATEVAQKKYGDCKALSNYMVSILNEAGIKAYPVIIKAGRGETELYEDFPSNQFNHVVACIPGKDTIWLECTSQTVSWGFMGSFTGNRKALLVKEDGGYLVSTPRYTANENLQLRKIDATIDAFGNLTAEVKTKYTGEQEEEAHRYIHVYTAEEREKRLNQKISLPSYTIEKSDYKESKGKIPFIDEYLKVTAPNYASITGKRLFIQPNLINKLGEKLSTEKPRRFPFQFIISYKDVDTVHIAIPDGYVVESMPRDISTQAKWGKYSISFKAKENLIEVIRVNELYAGTYPASDYVNYAKYSEDMYKADRGKMVLVKKE